jgi:hemolysin activation/secretion protein
MARLRIASFLVVLVLFISSSAHAQTPPPGESPEAMASRYRSEMEKEKNALEKKKAKPPKIEVEKAAREPVPEGPSFTLKELTITGATVFTPEDLKPLYASRLDKTVNFKDLEAVAKSIEERYDERGYLTTTVYVPPQPLKDGKVEIAVVEGKAGNINVEGNKWFPADLLKKWFHLKKMISSI